MTDVDVNLIEETIESNILQEEINVSQITDEVNVSTNSEEINVSVTDEPDINVSLNGINVDNTNHSSMFNLDYDNSGHTGFQEELIAGKGIDITGTTISTNLSDFTTTDLTEGTNLYYTEARVSANSDVTANTAKISFDSASSTKLGTIEEGAEVNVQSDWNATIGDALILNKPTLYTSLDFDTDFGLKTTDDLTEGSSNFYDKTVAFTGGTNVSIGGTYPNFSITDNSGTSDLSLGETLSTAYRGDRGKTSYDHSQLTSGNPHNVSLNDVGGTTDHTALNNLNSTNYSHLTSTQLNDLTDAGDSSLHYHSTDRARTNHTGTQTASTISDFDTEVSNNTDVATNTSKISFDWDYDYEDLINTPTTITTQQATNISANTTHKTSNGSDHSYINQDVTTSSSPSFQDIKIADKIYLDFSSNTYLKYNSSTQEVEIYVNGSIRASF